MKFKKVFKSMVIGSTLFLLANFAVAKPDKLPLKEIMEIVSLHARTELNQEQMKRVDNFGQTPELTALRTRFLKEFNLSSDLTAFGHSMAIKRYDQNARVVNGNERIWSGWVEKNIAESPYFIFPERPAFRNLNFVAPLRVEDDLIILLKSVGPDAVGQYSTTKMPADFAIIIASRLDEVDQPELLSTADAIRYQLRLGTRTTQEMNDDLNAERSRYPDMPSVYGHRYDLDSFRLDMNLALRDFRGEFLEFVTEAVKPMPMENRPDIDHLMKNGGTGIMRARDGRQFLIQTIHVSNTVIDYDIELLRGLLNPNLKIKKKIKLPTSAAAAQKIFDGLRSTRSAKESKDVISALGIKIKANQDESQAIFQDVMSKLRKKDAPGNCDGALGL